MPLPVGPHPRSRGENNRRRVVAWARPGSSPLTRGKRRHQPGNHRRSGLIPVHAGKTGLCRCRRSVRWAHPRSRGENSPAPRASFWRLGSSPLARGKLHGALLRRKRVRLIPAHAGKTHRCARYACRRGTSPLTQGKPQVKPQRKSSSPLTRGKPSNDVGRGVIDGLIPTHAGKTRPPL